MEVEAREAVRCNCSICDMKAFLHVIVPEGRFELLSGAEALSEYTFNTHTAKHLFCRHCGISAFYRPRSHPDGVSANLRCFDGDVQSDFEVTDFDGKNWEANVARLTQRPRE